jgi:hypothetical protein
MCVCVCVILRIAPCLDSRLTDGGEIAMLTRACRALFQKDLVVLISVRICVNPRPLMPLDEVN